MNLPASWGQSKGYGVCGLGFKVKAKDRGLGVWGIGVKDSGLRAQVQGNRVHGLGLVDYSLLRPPKA